MEIESRLYCIDLYDCNDVYHGINKIMISIVHDLKLIHNCKRIQFHKYCKITEVPGNFKKNQPIRSSRLASYGEHIYECLVLLYRL